MVRKTLHNELATKPVVEGRGPSEQTHWWRVGLVVLVGVGVGWANDERKMDVAGQHLKVHPFKNRK